MCGEFAIYVIYIYVQDSTFYIEDKKPIKDPSRFLNTFFLSKRFYISVMLSAFLDFEAFCLRVCWKGRSRLLKNCTAKLQMSIYTRLTGSKFYSTKVVIEN